jgi:hypothetical protein
LTERKQGNARERGWNNLLRILGLNFEREEVSSMPAEWRLWSENLERAQQEWKYARLYFDSVTDPDLIDHAIYNLEASEKKYTYLLKQAREIGIRGDGFLLS